MSVCSVGENQCVLLECTLAFLNMVNQCLPGAAEVGKLVHGEGVLALPVHHGPNMNKIHPYLWGIELSD